MLVGLACQEGLQAEGIYLSVALQGRPGVRWGTDAVCKAFDARSIHYITNPILALDPRPPSIQAQSEVGYDHLGPPCRSVVAAAPGPS